MPSTVIVVHGRDLQGTHNVTLTNVVLGSLTDPKQGATASSYTATIDWGDGSATSVGTVAGSNGLFTISGTHTYSAGGIYPINVSIGVTDGRVAYLASLAQVS